MNNRQGFACAALIATAALTFAMLLNSGTIHAKPACVNTAVLNTTGFTITLVMYDANGLQGIFTIPSSANPTQIQMGLFSPIGVVSSGGIHYPFVAPPNPGCTGCITLSVPGGGTTCGNVCYDAPTCSLGITACGPPCAP